MSANIDGATVPLGERVDSSFSVAPVRQSRKKLRSWPIPSNFGRAWTKDQRQQFGRFAHTLSAASIVGAVGYWHSTQVWTVAAAANVALLLVLFVLLFSAGMDSMNGE